MKDPLLYGDWEKALKVFSKFGDVVLDGARLGMKQGALMTEAALVGHIEKQDLGWRELSKSYAAYKKRKNLSNLTWVATSTTLNSITTDIQKDSAFVGVLRTAPGKDGNAVNIAATIEYGSEKRNIKARPLFRPTWQEMEPKVNERIMKGAEKALKGLIRGS